MPIHDWTRVDAGLFHDFHQGWTVALRTALNEGVLPSQYIALVEQSIAGPIPDVLTLRVAPTEGNESDSDQGGVAVAVSPPCVKFIQRSESSIYAKKANRIVVRHRHGGIVAVIEIVSPGNKSSRAAFQQFIEKSAMLVYQGVHLQVIDLFPATKRDPFGVHRALWDELRGDQEDLPASTTRTLASYDAGPPHVAYVEDMNVGDRLPDMPLFLRPNIYIPTPLEATYQSAWKAFPRPLKKLLED